MNTRSNPLMLLLVMAIALSACGTGDAGTAEDIAVGEPSLGMCAEDVPDCVDLVVRPGDDQPTPGFRPIEVEGDVAGEGLPTAGERLIGIDGNRLDIGFSMGVEDCFALESVDVAETDSRVTVDILIAPRDPAQACIAMAEARSVSVELSTPLGDRVLEVGGVVLAG